jgi:predicted oxidoreductase
MNPKPKIIIGCMSWANWGKQLSTLEQADLIEFCVSQGNSTFDHADIYGDYTTEAAFGKALRESAVKREDIQLISKCGIQLVGKTRSNRVKHYNYSKDYILWSVDQSLKNLQTDYLDALLLHRPSPLMHPQEIAEAVTKLQEAGKIRHFGVSNFTPSQVDLINELVSVEVNQVEFSLTQPSAMYNGTLDQCLLKDIQPMSWSPLGLVFKESNEKTARILSVLNQLSEKYTLSADTLLLAWILKHPANISPVIGTTNLGRIKNANKALDVEIELEDWFTLLEASEGKEIA